MRPIGKCNLEGEARDDYDLRCSLSTRSTAVLLGYGDWRGRKIEEVKWDTEYRYFETGYSNAKNDSVEIKVQ